MPTHHEFVFGIPAHDWDRTMTIILATTSRIPETQYPDDDPDEDLANDASQEALLAMLRWHGPMHGFPRVIYESPLDPPF